MSKKTDAVKVTLEKYGLSGAVAARPTTEPDIFSAEKPRMKMNPDLSIVIPVVTRIANNNGRCPFMFTVDSTEDDHCPCSKMLTYGECVAGLYIKEEKGE